MTSMGCWWDAGGMLLVTSMGCWWDAGDQRGMLKTVLVNIDVEDGSLFTKVECWTTTLNFGMMKIMKIQAFFNIRNKFI